MGITKRFIYLLLLGVVFLVATNFIFNVIFIFLAYNFLCLVLLIIDYRISPQEIPVTIEYCGSEKLSLEQKEAISFTVYNKKSYQLFIELKDELPEYNFQAENELMSGPIMASEKEVFEYFVIPTKRGLFTFENVYLKFSGRLRLCTKSFKIKLKREFKVYPNLKNIKKYRLMMFNNRLNKQGRRSIRQQGRGTSFESLREYIPGDDYKNINWKATARMNQPIINQYQPEKNQHVYILLDTGRPMSYSIKGHRKLDLAVNTAVVLSDIINQKGDQSGLLLFNNEVKNMVMPGKGIEHRNKIIEALYKIEASKDTSNYEEALYYLKRKERNRSIIFLFTDFETREEAEHILEILPYIARNNIVVILLMKNEKLEKIAKNKPSNQKELFDKGVALELLSEREKIIALLNRKGVFCLQCPAEELNYTAVNKYIKLKNKGGF